MKRNILVVFLFFIVFSALGQVKTKITGFIPEYKESNADVEINLFFPNIIGNGRKVDYKAQTSGGHFEFEVEINEPLSISATLNDKQVFFPGAYSILVNPGDSIHIEIPRVKTLGIMNLKFSGKGSKKVDFEKAIVGKILSLYKEDPAYRLQSLSYKFASTDKKLNAIDSLCNSYKDRFPKSEIELIQAMQYETVMDMLMYSSMQSTSDSLSALFKKYIINNSRMRPFLKNHIIRNYGMTALSDYVILSEFDNLNNYGRNSIKKDNPLAYCKLVLKHLSKYPAAKEYLLSTTALNVFSSELDSKHTDSIYRLYSDNVDHTSAFYKKVSESYHIVKTRLKKGMPFYSFSLPDTTGKVHLLSDFKGKVVVIDFWFNGCGACRELAPIMSQLESEYVGENIQFISISIDRTKSLWLKGIGKYCTNSSMQLFTEGLETKHPLVEFLNPGGYPFLIALDKNGDLIGPPPFPKENKIEFKRFIAQYL